MFKLHLVSILQEKYSVESSELSGFSLLEHLLPNRTCKIKTYITHFQKSLSDHTLYQTKFLQKEGRGGGVWRWLKLRIFVFVYILTGTWI